MRPKVFITHRTFPEVLEYLKPHAEVETESPKDAWTPDALASRIRDKHGILTLLVDPVTADVMDAAQDLKIVANCAVGFDNIDILHARKKGILVTNTPGVLTETTADLTWALILAVARKIPQAHAFTRAGKYMGWRLDLFLGQEVTGKRLGIVGMGRIGRAVASRAKAFRMEVVYSDPHRLSPDEEENLGARCVCLEELLATSDVVSIHTSLNPETHHLLSREKLALMKPAAILVNAARGPVVDERALAEALEQKKIWGAGLDVYEREPEIETKLLELDNVVLLPHIGSATRETRLKMAMTAARNLVQGLRGERPANLIT